MTRAVACLSAAVIGMLVTAISIEAARTRAPRFLVTIAGTQHFDWTLTRADAGICVFRGHGEQSQRFGTSRPVRVIAPSAGPSGSREFRAFSRRAWRRVVPLAGREGRAYRVVLPPAGPCPGLKPEFRSDCRGTNPLHPRAGVVLLRSGRRVALHVPVDTPWIERMPSVCDIRLFDLRNFFLSAVFGLRTYRPARGGTFENRRARTLRYSVRAEFCVDPSQSSDDDLFLKTSCGPPPAGRRGPILTGTLTAQWTVTFRRAR
jgi:hypothetical protein